PPFTHTLFASGAPGKGVLPQSANAQSAPEIGMTAPSSDARFVSVALAVSRLAVSCATGSDKVFAPAGMLLKRASARPTMLETSGFFAIGTVIVLAPIGKGHVLN